MEQHKTESQIRGMGLLSKIEECAKLIKERDDLAKALLDLRNEKTQTPSDIDQGNGAYLGPNGWVTGDSPGELKYWCKAGEHPPFPPILKPYKNVDIDDE